MSNILKLVMTPLTDMNRSKAVSRATKRNSEESLAAKNTFVPKEIKIESGTENLVVMEQVDMPRVRRFEVFSCKAEYDNPFYLNYIFELSHTDTAVLRQTCMEIIQTKPLFIHGSGLWKG